MNLPTLKRHENGKFYVHWTVRRRTARASTGCDDARGAILFYAAWVKANVDMLAPPGNPAGALRQLQKLRGL